MNSSLMLGTYQVVVEMHGDYRVVTFCEAPREQVYRHHELIVGEILAYKVPMPVLEKVVRYGLRFYGLRVVSVRKRIVLEVRPAEVIEINVVLRDIELMKLDPKTRGIHKGHPVRWAEHHLLESRGILFEDTWHGDLRILLNPDQSYRPRGTLTCWRDIAERSWYYKQTVREPERMIIHHEGTD